MAWKDIDEKNNFKTITNNIEYRINSALIEINKIVGENLNLPNIGTIYRNKTFDLEEQFSKMGINFFDKIVLRDIINNYFFDLIEENIKIIYKIINKLKISNGLFLFEGTSKIGNKIISNVIKKYVESCSKITDFNIKDHISLAMISYFSSDEYYIFTPGEFINTYERAKDELLQLGFEDLLPYLDKKILPLIKKQEIETSKFNLKMENKEK